MDSIRSTRSNSSSVPATLAGWVGKVATSPMRRKGDGHGHNHNQNHANMSLALGGLSIAGELGDLIELDATPDEVSRQLHDEIGSGSEITPRQTPLIDIDKGDDGDDLLDERFPVRGRVRRAYMAD